MQLGEDRRDDIWVAVPIGRVDSTTSGDLEQRLLARVGSGERRVVVDMAGIEYISSAGLRVFLRLARKLKDAGGTLVLCAMGEPVRQVFELAGFLPLFVIEASRELAIARLEQKRSSP